MKKIHLLILFTSIAISVSAQHNFNCGDTLIDTRDGKKYPTVMIGNQCWTAKNIDIGTQVQNTLQTNNNVIEKTCYENKKENCDTFGGLYIYEEAVQYVSNEKKIQGVCPVNWHIASKEEFENLIRNQQPENAAQKIKVTKQNNPKWDGNNESKFSAVPAGLAYYDVFGRKGDWSVFWTGTPVNANYAWSIELDNYYMTLSGYSDVKVTNTYLVINAFSVRCIKD